MVRSSHSKYFSAQNWLVNRWLRSSNRQLVGAHLDDDWYSWCVAVLMCVNGGRKSWLAHSSALLVVTWLLLSVWLAGRQRSDRLLLARNTCLLSLPILGVAQLTYLQSWHMLQATPIIIFVYTFLCRKFVISLKSIRCHFENISKTYLYLYIVYVTHLSSSEKRSL